MNLSQLQLNDEIALDLEGNIYLYSPDGVKVFNQEGNQIWP